jgi:starvation-inducible outer membrane lipoprotein
MIIQSMNPSSLLTIVLLLTACTSAPKQIAYTSHYTNSYHSAILDKCKYESDMMAFMIAQAKMSREENITQEDVSSLRKMLADSCVKYYRITI